MRRKPAQPHFEDGGIYRKPWWAYQDSNSHLEVFSSDEEVDPDRVTAGAELSPGFSTELW